MSYYFTLNPSKFPARQYDPFFFFEDRFLNQDSDAQRASFFLVKQKTATAVAEIHFGLSGDVAFSPLTGSFGSLQTNRSPEIALFHEFLKFVLDKLVGFGAKKICIKSFPLIYDPVTAEIVMHLLSFQRFQLVFGDLTYYLDVRNSFSLHLQQSEHARLRAALNMGMIAEKWADPDLDECYDVLKRCRDRKNYPMTLSEVAFKKMFQRFPDIYSIFRVRKESRTLAVAVMVKISSEVLYNFYIGEEPEFRKHSPNVLLLSEVVNYARLQGFRIVDLGIGTDQGIPNFGLMRFKQNMGGIASLKPVFEKEL